ncbi:MAG TPA: maleylpyruvate isomerase family mycothiol-dependent enzyme [Acidimicrobiales bacterium]|nr:maleylpyruvate isomerase family mycothiol-dependent enzyme [Acidimicrobiales bacterium]
MLPEDYLAVIRAEADALGTVLESHGGAAVPSCPGWDVAQLAGHLGRVHRWVTAMVRAKAPDRLGFPPRPEVVDRPWFDEGVTELLAALEEAGPDVTMWTFPNGGGTSRFWFRRQAEETAVHRWDAQHAVTPGRAAPIATDTALAGVDELLDVFLHGRKAHLGGSVHFHATDSPHGEWIVRLDEDGALEVGHGHEKGDVALRATASDLLLWLWGRPVGEAGLEVFGDEGLLDQWRSGFGMG